MNRWMDPRSGPYQDIYTNTIDNAGCQSAGEAYSNIYSQCGGILCANTRISNQKRHVTDKTERGYQFSRKSE